MENCNSLPSEREITFRPVTRISLVKYPFLRIPKYMFQDPAFRKLSSAAKALYALLVERSVLSFSNKWLDQNGRCYVIYPIAQIEEQLGCQTKKASSALTELAKIGLIRRQRSGYGSPYKITVLSYSPAASSDENTPGHSGPSLEYITPEKAKEFPYIMVPRPMLSHSAFSDLSLDAKLLYCVLYNRFSLNLAYGKGDVSYTVCTVQEAASIMGCYRDKAMGLLKELSTFGLIRTEKRHSQLPSKIFVNEFLLKDAEELKEPFALFPAAPAEAPEDQGNKDDAARPENVSPSSAKDEGPDGLKSENGRYGGRKSGETVVGNKEMPGSENGGYEGRKEADAAVGKLTPINPRGEKTFPSYPDHHISPVGGSAPAPSQDDDNEKTALFEMLRRQVDYFALLSRYPDERAVIDAVLERIVDILQAEDDQKYALASTLTLPVYHLKKQFLSVDGRILGSVLDRCSQNRSRAGAYISYVLVSLYRESNRPKPRTRSGRGGNAFNTNYMRQDYDFDALDKALHA